MTASQVKRKWTSISVLSEKVLGVKVLRGYAPLSFLARISRADVYDKSKNPLGTQRDLSPRHARDAYLYVSQSKFAFWPEVFLCLRDGKAAKIKLASTSRSTACSLIEIDEKYCVDNAGVAISRVDGNHRLHYADGTIDGYPPIDKVVSFCIAYDITRSQEISLFRDINNNQKRMNTSHLDNITARLSGEERLKFEQPALYIAKKLSEEKESPFVGRVYDGGAKPTRSYQVPLASLKTGIGYMLSRPTRLTALPDVDAQYKVIRNFFVAVKHWQPEAWAEPKKFLLLRGAGFWGICFVGSFVIDRVLAKNAFQFEPMLRLLKSGKKWDWSPRGDFQGLSGRGGAVKISERITKELADEDGMSTAQLFRKIMGS